MKKFDNIEYLGMCFDGYDDLYNKVDYLESLGYKSGGLPGYIQKSNKIKGNKYIYINLHTNNISISKFFF